MASAENIAVTRTWPTPGPTRGASIAWLCLAALLSARCACATSRMRRAARPSLSYSLARLRCPEEPHANEAVVALAAMGPPSLLERSVSPACPRSGRTRASRFAAARPWPSVAWGGCEGPTAPRGRLRRRRLVRSVGGGRRPGTARRACPSRLVAALEDPRARVRRTATAVLEPDPSPRLEGGRSRDAAASPARPARRHPRAPPAGWPGERPPCSAALM